MVKKNCNQCSAPIILLGLYWEVDDGVCNKCRHKKKDLKQDDTHLRVFGLSDTEVFENDYYMED